MKEIWKGVFGYEQLYKVSSLGRVKSLDRIDTMGRLKVGRMLKSTSDRRGYLRVGLFRLDGKMNKKLVHRLVGESFIENIKDLSQINHIDENKSNNKVENLEWMNERDNKNYSANKKSTSKYAGVHKTKHGKKRWRSSIGINNKTIMLGYFNHEIDAAKAYVNFCVNNNIGYKALADY